MALAFSCWSSSNSASFGGDSGYDPEHSADLGRQVDKNLSASDVQTIAQAILLRYGNHSWKIANVVLNQDDTVSLAFATQSGDIAASFAMDTRRGRLRRVRPLEISIVYNLKL